MKNRLSFIVSKKDVSFEWEIKKKNTHLKWAILMIYLKKKLIFFCRMDETDHARTVDVCHSNSSTSSNSELDQDLAELDLNGSSTNGEHVEGDEENGGTTSSNGSLIIINKNNLTQKKRVSSSRTPTRKAKRVRFFRNGDKFYGGVVIPVSNERYR